MADGAAASAKERRSFCRICMAHCGVVVSLDENDRLVDIRADRDDPQTLGYACFKGLQAVDQHNGEARILHPLKRQPDGSFARIGLEQALDEIADIIKQVIAEDGPEAIAGFRGGGAFFNAGGVMLLADMMETLGSPKLFSANTIDQSAKYVAVHRVGIWPPGAHPFHGSEVVLLIGANPLVSITTIDVRNPLKRLKAEKARGLKLLVIDPRVSETARFADNHLQPLPGEDATIVAGILRYVFEQGLEDKEFLAAHASQVELLRDAVQPFTPDYVARRADIPEAQFIALADTFARAKRGAAMTATGPDMGPHSNLAEHLVYCLNIVCGRFVREGEQVNPGFISERGPRPCQVIPAGRPWEKGYQSRVGDYGVIWGELPTGIMADEMLQPGPGRVRVFINHGGNPASCVPDQRKLVNAFNALDLMVSMECYMTPTARLSHYIIPPVLQYERPDMPLWLWEYIIYPEPYTRYTPAIAKPPEDAEVAEDGYVFWALSKRLGIPMKSCGVELDMVRPPTPDELLATVARHAPASFEEIQQAGVEGLFDPGGPHYAQPGNPGPEDRFTLMPDDVLPELKALAAEDFTTPTILPDGRPALFRTAVRRSRERFNSTGGFFQGVRERRPYNTAMMNPEDLAALGLVEGDFVKVTSDTGAIKLKAEADETVRRGVVQIIHGFGDLPDEDTYLARGVSPNLLISTDRELQTINATPRMSAIPVAVSPTN